MRIRILKDDDAHTYFVPVGSEKAFQEHLDAIYNCDVDVPPMPDGVVAVGRHLSCYTFADPEVA